jgi:hypothetical protein
VNEPRRWLDDPRTARELRDLLTSAAAPPPLPPALNVQLAEYAATLAAQGVLAKVGGLSLWQKLVLFAGGSSKAVALFSLVGVVGAVAVGAYASHRGSAPSSHGGPLHARAPVQTPKPRSPTFTSTAASPGGLPQLSPSSAALGVGSAALGVSAAERPHPSASAARDAELGPSAAVASSNESSIVGEAKLLSTARSFLDDSPALSLAVTEQHRQKYPLGQLSAEREFVAIEALLRLGRRQEAERRAAPLLAAGHDGLYTRRLHRLLSPDASKFENH